MNAETGLKISGSDDAIVSKKMAKINMNGEFGMRKGETMIYECGVRNAEGGNNDERGQNVYRGPHGYLNIDNKTRFRYPNSNSAR